MNVIWSDHLIEETREALEDQESLSPDSCLHLKNRNGGFGTISSENLLTGKLLIQGKNTGAEYFYTTIDELITSGWAVD